MFKDVTPKFEEARDALNRAERVVIISHVRPDADAIGANCALKMVLKNFGKEVVSACADPVQENCFFINGAKNFVHDFPVNEFDLLVSVDCGGKKRTGFDEKPGFLDGKVPLLNIDHHDTNDDFGKINIVVPTACATCFILLKFFEHCRYKITPDIATALLAGIYFDTGSLTHSNTTPFVYSAVASLLRKGAKLDLVTQNLFKAISVQQMRLLGRILERTRVNEDGVVTSAAMENDYKESGANSHDASRAVDFLNTIAGSKFCILLSDDEKGEVKGSVRTQRDDLDISKVASALGGGGHKKAAGFGVRGKIKEERVFKIIEE
jgi:bifunctional oligoribonuclease and PAP phosphatase NrnA